MSNSIKDQVKKAPLWLKIAVVGVLGFVVAPVIMIAIKGMIGFGIAALLAFIAITFGPVIMDKLANRAHEAAKQEAMQSPIPTLERQAIEYHETVGLKQTALKTILGKLETFKTKCDGYAKKYPDDTLENDKNQRLIGQAVKSVEKKKRDFALFVHSVEEFDKEVEKAADKWDIAMAMQDFDLVGDFGGDTMKLIKARTALTAVEDAVNRNMANLEVSLLEELPINGEVLHVEVKQVEALPSMVSSKENTGVR